MGIPVFILGESGSGKTSSLRNFKSEEVGILSVVGKPLPFKSDLKTFNVRKKAKEINKDRYKLIKDIMSGAKVKSIVIDDSQYLLAFDSFDRANEKGYDKFTNMAVSFEKLLEFCVDDLPDDVIVYFLHHIETSENGKIKAKTIGKMLDTQLGLEGVVSIVLLCQNNEGIHTFATHSYGNDTVKTPIGMFEEDTIDNDLKLVDETIRKYYEI